MTDANMHFAFDDCGAWPLPDNRVLVRNARSGRHAILTPDVHAALATCTRFQTLDEHAARIARTFPALQGQQAAVRQVLDSVRSDGLLISAAVYATTLKPRAHPNINVDKPVAAVITWERPEALLRVLASIEEHVDLNNLERLLVIDDSRSADIQQQNRASVSAFAERVEVPVLFMGAPEQKGFLEAIVRQLPQLENQVRFLIDRERWDDYWTSGLARTMALLLSVGRRLLVLDDDVLCEVLEPEREPGVAFGDVMRNADFYTDPEAWQGQRAQSGTDPFLRHLSILGSELQDALGALGVSQFDSAVFKNAEATVVERLRPDSRVLITECGSVGDAGTPNLNWLTELRGESLARLIKDPDTLATALRERNAWHGRRISHVLPRANMSQLTGLDHRVMLPPYIPILRGEDRLFGDMVEFMYPDDVVIDQSWSIPHLPLPARQWKASERHYDSSQPFPSFAKSLVEHHQGSSSAKEPLKRLSHLARLYDDLADRSHEQLVNQHESESLGAKARIYSTLREALTAAGDDAPEEWRAFLSEALSRLNQELVEDPAGRTLRGDPSGLEGEALTTWWRTFWREFSEALRAWPAIRLAASRVEI